MQNRPTRTGSSSCDDSASSLQALNLAGPERAPSQSAISLEDGMTCALRETFALLQSSTDALFAAVHVAAMETGLKEMADCTTGVADNPSSGPPWRKGVGFYRVTYCHPLCDALTCSVTGTVVGRYLMLLGAVNSEEVEPRQCPLELIDFQVPSATLSSGPDHVYKNLKLLSQTVKRSFFNLFLDEMIAGSGVSRGLVALPMDIQMRILLLLDAVSLTRLGRTCKYLNETVSEPSLWRQLCQRDFHHETIGSSSSINWKDRYRRHYLERKLTENAPGPVPFPYYEEGVPPWADPSAGSGIPDYAGFDPQFPGMIGGYHDLHPTLPYMPGGLQPSRGGASPMGWPHARFDPYGPLPEQHIPPRRPRRRGGGGAGGLGGVPRYF